MSWSVSFIGTPDKIKEALTKESARLTGHSKEEFDAALPHIVGILGMNHSKSYGTPYLNIIANGHGFEDHSSLSVSITPASGIIL